MSAGRNWAGNLSYSASRLIEPVTLERLREAVASNERIRALGSRHSFNDIADTPGTLLSLAGLEPWARIDAHSRTVTFPAGMRYGDLAVRLEEAGWALSNLASLPHISVAGAIATGTHGSGDGNETLASDVMAMKMILADGSLLELHRGDPAFAGAVVGLGVLGVVVELTLAIEPSYTMRQDLYIGVGIDQLVESFEEASAAGYSVSVNPDWSEADSGRIRVKSRSADAPDLILGAPRVTAETPPLGATERDGTPGPWYDRLPHFKLEFTPSFGDELQSEYLLPRGLAGEAIAALSEVAPAFMPHVHGVELRTMAGDQWWMSGAYGRDTVAIHFTWRLEPEAVDALVPLVEQALEPFEARAHWGKVFARLRGDYPRLEDFLALRARLDPTGKFLNGYTRRVLGV